MLYRSYICNIQSQNFSIMQRQHLLKVNKEPVLLSLRNIFQSNCDLEQEFSREVIRLLGKQPEKVKKYVAYYGVICSNLFFTQDMKLCTCSRGVLEYLRSCGKIKGSVPELKYNVVDKKLRAVHLVHQKEDYFFAEDVEVFLEQDIYPFVSVSRAMGILVDYLEKGNLEVLINSERHLVTRCYNHLEKPDMRLAKLPVFDLEKEIAIYLPLNETILLRSLDVLEQ